MNCFPSVFSHFPPPIQAGNRFSLSIHSASGEDFANFLDFVSERSSPLRRMGFEDGKISTRIVRISWIDERKESSVGP